MDPNFSWSALQRVFKRNTFFLNFCFWVLVRPHESEPFPHLFFKGLSILPLALSFPPPPSPLPLLRSKLHFLVEGDYTRSSQRQEWSLFCTKAAEAARLKSVAEILWKVTVLEFLCIVLEHLWPIDVQYPKQEWGIAANPQNPESSARGFCALPGPVKNKQTNKKRSLKGISGHLREFVSNGWPRKATWK